MHHDARPGSNPTPGHASSERPVHLTGGPERHAEQRKLGRDGLLTLYPPDHPWAARIDLSFRHPTWAPRQPATMTTSRHPGTALRIDETWYEVVEAGSIGQATTDKTSYFLAPWRPQDTIRIADEPNEDTIAQTAAKVRAQARRQKQGAVLWFLAPLVGQLPAWLQNRIDNDIGVSPTRATFLSAVLNLVIGAYGIATWVAVLVGRAEPSVVSNLMPVFLYLTIESLFRLGMVNATGEPFGCAYITIPITLTREFVNSFSPEAKKRAQRAKIFRSLDNRMLTLRDSVVRRHPNRPVGPGDEPWDLEVISELPKDHWTLNVTGVRYGDELYVPVYREVSKGQDGRPRHRFRLREEDPETALAFKYFAVYTPEEAREVYRQKRYLDTAAWLESFPYLWGLTDAETQRRLSEVYRYDAPYWTRWSIIASIIFGLCVAYLGLYNRHLLPALFGLWLIGEGALRWKNREAMVPSVLGHAFRPFANEALKWAPVIPTERPERPGKP